MDNRDVSAAPSPGRSRALVGRAGLLDVVDRPGVALRDAHRRRLEQLESKRRFDAVAPSAAGAVERRRGDGGVEAGPTALAMEHSPSSNLTEVPVPADPVSGGPQRTFTQRKARGAKAPLRSEERRVGKE